MSKKQKFSVELDAYLTVTENRCFSISLWIAMHKCLSSSTSQPKQQKTFEFKCFRMFQWCLVTSGFHIHLQRGWIPGSLLRFTSVVSHQRGWTVTDSHFLLRLHCIVASKQLPYQQSLKTSVVCCFSEILVGWALVFNILRQKPRFLCFLFTLGMLKSKDHRIFLCEVI